MAPHLYALKEELDMVTQDITGLKNSYTAIDHIAKRFDDLWHEQLMQAEQMRRIEERLNMVEERLGIVGERLDTIEAEVGKMQQEIRHMKEEIGQVKKLLILICRKLDINTDQI